MADDTKLHSEGVFDYARDNIEGGVKYLKGFLSN